MDWTEMCAPWEAQPECFTCRHQLQVPPAGGLVSSVGQCCGACLVGFTVRVSSHFWVGEGDQVFLARLFLEGESQLSFCFVLFLIMGNE